MEIIIHSETKKIDTDYQKAIDEYTKRTLPFSRVSVKCYKKPGDIKSKKGSYVFLVQAGKDTISSPMLADKIKELNLKGISCIEFVIWESSAHPDGLPYEDVLNLSSFSMSRELSCVVLTEQLYRAFTILNNITYHK